MEWNGFQFPDDLYYDAQHTWGRLEGNLLTQGMTDFGQKIAREIIFVGLPRIGRQVRQGESYLSVESGKWVGRLPAFVSGKVVEVNEELEEEGDPINYAPYSEGWMARIELNDPAELTGMMKADSPEYLKFLEAEKEKYANLLGL